MARDQLTALAAALIPATRQLKIRAAIRALGREEMQRRLLLFTIPRKRQRRSSYNA